MIVIEPVLVVTAAGAFKTKALPTTTDPTLDVADCPVKPTVIAVGDIVPTDEVACCPSKTKLATTEPTLEVTLWPVNVTIVGPCAPRSWLGNI